MSDEFTANLDITPEVTNTSTDAPNPDFDGLVAMDEVVETPPSKRKFKLKVDGQEVEEEYDDESLVRELQLAKAAQKRMMEAAKERSEAEQQKREILEFVKLVKSDPAALMTRLGMSQEQLVQFADQTLANYLEERTLTPEERARRQEQAELNALREERRREAEERERSAVEAQRAEVRQQIETSLVDAIESTDLPKDPEVRTIILYEAVRMLAADKVRSIRAGVPSMMTPEKAVARAKEARVKESTQLLSKFTDESLYDLLGEEVIKKIRKVDTARHKSRKLPAQRNSRNTSPIQREVSKEKSVIGEQEFEEYLKSWKQ